ncbi:hypothetical protein Droror1_Dr00003634 [Drosera rotundifolia]
MDPRLLLYLLRSPAKTLPPLKLLATIHQKTITQGIQNHTQLTKTLINLYTSHNNPHKSHQILVTIENPSDITIWNTLLASYTRNTMFEEALELFDRLLRCRVLEPDGFTYPSVLKASGGLGRVLLGEMVHGRVVRNGVLADVVVSSGVVGMYGKCGRFGDAVKVFDEMPERDAACWNCVISCYYQSGQCERALGMYGEMKRFGFEPDSVTLTTVISACGRLLNLEAGKRVHRELLDKGFALDGYVSSALVDMYGKFGCVEIARGLFEKIPRKSIVAWNSMISGYSLQGDSRTCMELFRRMNEEGTKPTLTTIGSLLMACSRSANLYYGKFIHGYVVKNVLDQTDIFVFGSLIDFYFKCEAIRMAESVFHLIPKTNVIMWNVMISGYVSIGCFTEALEVFRSMREARLNPDSATFCSVLSACSQLAAIDVGKEIHDYIKDCKFEKDELVMGALLDMYAKCGAIEEARSVFNQMPERDLVSWTSMITAFGSHGRPFEALKLFEDMKLTDIEPDRVVLLAVLSTCSHAGLVDEGYNYFDQMQSNYGIEPTVEHYSCLLDLLGRAGRLHEAYAILQKEPRIREDAGLLSTLFSACHLHGELQLGEEIADFLVKKDPNCPSTYVILGNMYASLKMWDEARKVRLKIRDLRLKKSPGCSWIDVDRKIHTFLAEDNSHAQVEAIHDCLAILASHMEKEKALGLGNG